MNATIETTEDRYLSACGALIIAGEWIAGREPDLSAQDIYDMIVKELRIESDTQVSDLRTQLAAVTAERDQMRNVWGYDVAQKVNAIVADHMGGVPFPETTPTLDMLDAIATRMGKLTAERDTLRRALEFYANPARWQEGGPDVGQGFSIAELDEGTIARDALQGGAS